MKERNCRLCKRSHSGKLAHCRSCEVTVEEFERVLEERRAALVKRGLLPPAPDHRPIRNAPRATRHANT